MDASNERTVSSDENTSYDSLVAALREIEADAKKQAKNATGEGYTYEQGRIDAVNEALLRVAMGR